MSRQRSGLVQPNRFLFVTDEFVADHFRRYCFDENLQLGQALSEAVIDYLIKVGKIPNRESLEIERQLNK